LIWTDSACLLAAAAFATEAAEGKRSNEPVGVVVDDKRLLLPAVGAETRRFLFDATDGGTMISDQKRISQKIGDA
jgi:hypothetical protein